jgi:hypothetical protein
MSDQEQFLARWSRRKRAASQAEGLAPAAEVPAAASANPAAAEGLQEPPRAGAARRLEPPFDPATLPPIDSITAATDIRPFLVPGVPAELTRAALRRAWTTDPGIRDFVGLAEYAWDFNSPDAVPGFGTVEMTAQLRSEIDRMIGRSLAADDVATAEARAMPESTRLREQSTPHPESPQVRNNPPLTLPVHRNEVVVATQKEVSESKLPPAAAKRHGRALPR